MGRGQREVNRLHPRRMDGAEVERVEVCRQKVENNLKLKNTEAALVTPSSLFLMVIGFVRSIEG